MALRGVFPLGICTVRLITVSVLGCGFVCLFVFNWGQQVGSWQLKWERAGLGDHWPDAGDGSLKMGVGLPCFCHSLSGDSPLHRQRELPGSH